MTFIYLLCVGFLATGLIFGLALAWSMARYPGN